ncbi:hypothetical protein [Streptacidiphilus melanogenes]|uniref:hypothetical protein n=1 Tax=Streptacidiphilus melanogenes TaxID=411235 RepID=UPI0005A984DD|nr:hypothetical protein [Streptacidiphilus melanogenes]
MTEPSIRADVVALFVGMRLVGPARTWEHDDGTPVTPEERELVLTMNWREIEAARDYMQRVLEYDREQGAVLDRIVELIEPYEAQLPEDARMDAVMQVMTDADRAELLALMEKAEPDTRTMP